MRSSRRRRDENAWHVQRLEKRVLRERPRDLPGNGQSRPVYPIDNGSSSRAGSVPNQYGWAGHLEKSGPRLPAQIGAGQNAGIDLVTEFREYSRRRQPHPISTGFVDSGLDADILDDCGRQPNQFLALHFGGEIAWIGIPVRDFLDKGRRIPGLQMRADLANTGFIEIADDFIAFRYRTDGIVHDECRPDVVSLENRLHLPRGLYRSHAVGAARTCRRPVRIRLRYR